jgi:hypothetical protein
MCSENAASITDNREGYPLDLDETVEIARMLKVRHPRLKGELMVITVDFLQEVTTAKGVFFVARDFKPTKKLCKKRTLEKFEIVRRYFAARNIDYPGVYRFIFHEARDGDSAHTPCYVGEAGNIGKRLLHHFRAERQTSVEVKPLGSRKLRAGWPVRGSIRNSSGDFNLQVLTIEGPVNFCGLTFGPDSIPTPLEDSFLRRMLVNVRGTPHILRDILKVARKKSLKHSNANPAVV